MFGTEEYTARVAAGDAPKFKLSEKISIDESKLIQQHAAREGAFTGKMTQYPVGSIEELNTKYVGTERWFKQFVLSPLSHPCLHPCSYFLVQQSTNVHRFISEGYIM